VLARQTALVALVEAPGGGERRPATPREVQQPRPAVVGLGVALDVPAALHVVDDPPGALLADLQPGDELADRHRLAPEGAEHEAVGSAQVAEPQPGLSLAKLAHELLVGQAQRCATLRASGGRVHRPGRPSRGSRDLCTWRITVAPGLDSAQAHTLDHDEIFMVTSGAIRLFPDGPLLGPGDGPSFPPAPASSSATPDPTPPWPTS